jgi:hypothetical protein
LLRQLHLFFLNMQNLLYLCNTDFAVDIVDLSLFHGLSTADGLGG